MRYISMIYYKRLQRYRGRKPLYLMGLDNPKMIRK